MQFKYPELLWALFLLLIPIIIHLFQLRRFKKTPFTNVKLLQKVVAESRRSSTLKKWLLLLTRLFLFTALILAFAQPFFAVELASVKKETVIYLDDSFSMQARINGSTLLEVAVQDLIKAVPKDSPFSLFTNGKVFKDVTLKDIQNDLLILPHTQKQLQLDEIFLKAQTLFNNEENTIKNIVLVSDFQRQMGSNQTDSITKMQKHLVQLQPDILENIAIDSIYISSTAPNTMELTALLSGKGNLESTPVSLFNKDKLIAKTAAVFDTYKRAQVVFTLPMNEVVEGRVEISDSGLTYDNQMYFNIDRKEKIKVLSVGDADSDFLRRIYSDDEFEFVSFTSDNLNYSSLETQNLIILNQVSNIPNALQNALKAFVSNGGSLTIIPNSEADFASYNAFLVHFFGTSLIQQLTVERNITNIAFAHPLYKNVFEKKITNFQYPKVSQYFRIRTKAPKVLSLQNNDAFLIGMDGVYFFTAALDNTNSNFKNSPLIVPTFFTMGANSFKLPQLYYSLNTTNKVDVPVTIAKDNILEVTRQDYKFIPQQQSFTNKTTLIFSENPERDGIYSVKKGKAILKKLSFNYSRVESNLTYLNLKNLNAHSKESTIEALFERMEKDNRVTELWKWFVILALLFILAEVLIQKKFK